MKTTTFRKREQLKKVDSWVLKEYPNGTIFCNELGKVFFTFATNDKPERARELANELEQVEKEIETCGDVYESISLRNKQAQLERLIENCKSHIAKGGYYVNFENENEVDEFCSLLQGASQDSIWSGLYATGLRFGNSQNQNNLTKILSDEQLDNMDWIQATSYNANEKNFSRNRERA